MQLLLLALIVVVAFFIFFGLGIVSSLLMFPVSISDLVGGLDFNDPAMIPVLKNLQIWQSVGIFIVPSIFIAWLASGKAWEFLGMNRKAGFLALFWVVMALLVAMPFLNKMVHWNEGMRLPEFMSGIEDWMREREDTAAGLTESFLFSDKFGVLLINILMIAIIPAFGEEFFFRGILQKLFGRWFRSTHAAVILASVLFSALHFQFYGFLPRFILGLIFGYVYAWTGNLWYPVAAHFVNNIIPVVAFYAMGDGALDQIDKIGTEGLSWAWVFGSILMTTLAMYQFRKYSTSADKSTPFI